MNYFFIALVVFCFATFVVTSAMIGRILIDSGLKESMFYNFDTWSLFYNYLKEEKSRYPKLLFWVNIISLIMIFVFAIAAAVYYN